MYRIVNTPVVADIEGETSALTEFYGSQGNAPGPRSLGERADWILELMANPSELGGMPSPAQEYEAQIRRLRHSDPPARSLGDEMVLLAAGPIGRTLPFGVRIGTHGAASIRALSGQAEQAANAIVQSFRNRLGRDPLVQEVLLSLGIMPDVGVNRATGLGNTFKGRTPEQVHSMFESKGFVERWRNPGNSRQRSYVNPDTDRPYHIDPDPKSLRDGTIEMPHVDAHRPREFRRNRYQGPLDEKRRWPLGERLYDRP